MTSPRHMPDNADLVYFNVRCHLAPVVADISQDSDYDPNVDRRIDAVVTFTPKYRTGEVIHAHTTLPPTGFLVMPVTALIDDGYLKLRTKPDTGAAPLPGTLHGLKAKIAADTGRELPVELDTRDALNYAPVRLLGNSTTLEIDPEYPLYYDFSFTNVKVDGKATNITITGGTFEAPWEMDATIDLLDYMPLTPGPLAQPMVVGPPGPQGPEGPPGPAGGPPGPQGPQGPAGLGIRYCGEVQSVAELDAITGQIQGDLWVVGNRNDDGTPAESYVWDEAKQDWIYAGYIQGVQGVPGPAGSVGPAGPAGPAGPTGADSTVPGPAGPEGPAGAVGPAGPAGADSTVPGPAGADGVDGAAATVDVGSTTTGAAGTSAAVTNTGTSSAAVLAFTIPRGERGVQGIPGDPGADSTVPGPPGIQGPPGEQGIPGLGIRFKGEVDSFEELPTDAVQGDLWVIGNRDDPSTPARAYVWDEATQTWVDAGQIQGAQGVAGPQGVPGSDGADGQAATVDVGSTTTGAAGTSASVVNTGTSGAAVFEFTIPVGATGPAGPVGPAGADSTVPGPAGPAGADSTVPGPVGPAGPAGADSTVPGPVGPAGPTAVSVDLENASTLGTDGLVYTASSVVGREVLTAADEVSARRAIGVPLTADETAAGITAVDTQFPVGHVYRYVTNTEPGTTDVTAGWQKFLSLGGVVELDARVDDVFRLTGQLTVKAKTTLRMGQQCVLLRDWSGTNGDFFSNSTLRNASAPTSSQILVKPGPWVPTVTDDNIFIEGGRIRPVDDTKTGAGLYMMGTTNLTIADTVVERSVKNWAFTVGGENFALRGIRVENNTEVLEDGVHVLYGSGSVKADYIHSGDDCFAVGSSWNLPVDGVDVHMGSFHSVRGFAIKVVQNREGITATGYPDPTEKIQNIRFHSGVGKAGTYRNGLMWMFATSKGLLQDITVDGVQIDGGTETHDGTNPHGVFIEKVAQLRLTNVTAKNSRRHSFQIKDCSEVELSSCVGYDPQGDISMRALEIENSANVRVVGGTFTRTISAPVRVAGVSSVNFSGVMFNGMIDNAPGLFVEGASEVTLTGSMFRKNPTATSAEGVRTGSVDSIVLASNCLFDVSRPFQPTQQPKFIRMSGVHATKRIVSGAFQVFGEDSVGILVRTGNTVDSVVNITGAYKGQLLTLTNAEAAPATNKITLKHGTGNIRNSSGVDIVLDGAVNASVTYIWNGTSWIQQSVGSDMVLLNAAQTLTAKTLTAPKIDGIYDTSGRLAIALPAAVLADSVQVDKKPKKSAETAEDAPQEVGNLEGQVTLEERLAANHIEVANANAGASPSIKAVGADANLNLDLAGKGTGVVRANGKPVLSWTATVPGNSSAAGTQGQLAADSGFLYVCLTSGAAGAAVWKRLSFELWV